jgi:thiol-disulfide isomerase/thioredoxin
MLLTRRLAAAGLAAALFAVPHLARAATEAPFTEAAFAAAKASGKPVLVEITASWCPTCARQRPILTRLFNRPDFAGLQVFNVDFDSQKDVVRAMGANMQSTLIVFAGGAEKGRSVGDTDPASIRALLEKARS